MTAAPTLDSAARTRWDVIVAGAGPAGSMAARALAQHGAKVLLVDEADFPRPKACGGCLGAAALDILEHAGLGHLPASLGAPATDSVHWHYGRHAIILPLPPGAAVSRQAFDAALAAEAAKAGADFLPRTSARLGDLNGDSRQVRLHADGATITASARVVLAADGLAGRFIKDSAGLHHRVDETSLMGLGAVLPATSAAGALTRVLSGGSAEGGQSRTAALGRPWAGESPAPLCPVAPDPPVGAPVALGQIRMVCCEHGYVGMVIVEHGQLNIAAALNPEFVKFTGGPAAAVVEVLHSAAIVPPPDLLWAKWLGTPLLTRRRWPPGLPRVLLLGDSASYVEPFTGEGIGWAMASALAAVPIVLEAITHWQDDLIQRWAQRQRSLLLRRQHVCRMITAALRRPAMSLAAMAILRGLPPAGPRMLAAAIHAPLSIPGGPCPQPV